jgi:hypothetical protein
VVHYVTVLLSLHWSLKLALFEGGFRHGIINEFDKRDSGLGLRIGFCQPECYFGYFRSLVHEHQHPCKCFGRELAATYLIGMCDLYISSISNHMVNIVRRLRTSCSTGYAQHNWAHMSGVDMLAEGSLFE